MSNTPVSAAGEAMPAALQEAFARFDDILARIGALQGEAALEAARFAAGRARLEIAIEEMITLLDDADAPLEDLEGDFLEVDVGDEGEHGADDDLCVTDDGHDQDVDLEYSLGWPENLESQTSIRAGQTDGDLEQGIPARAPQNRTKLEGVGKPAEGVRRPGYAKIGGAWMSVGR